jgi:hypothetical protein
MVEIFKEYLEKDVSIWSQNRLWPNSRAEEEKDVTDWRMFRHPSLPWQLIVPIYIYIYIFVFFVFFNLFYILEPEINDEHCYDLQTWRRIYTVQDSFVHLLCVCRPTQ